MATIDEPVSLPTIGRCKCCGRTLTDHNSILFEMGPVCRVKMGIKITKPRVHKADLAIKKPKIRKLKFSDEYDATTLANLDEWFSDKVDMP